MRQQLRYGIDLYGLNTVYLPSKEHVLKLLSRSDYGSYRIFVFVFCRIFNYVTFVTVDNAVIV